MNSAAKIAIAVLIGRFQPFHVGHAQLLQRAFESAHRVVVVLGSSFNARSAKNPFSHSERAAMIGASVTEEQRERLTFVAVRDYYEDRRWTNAVREAVRQAAAGETDIAVVGHFKDATSYYLNEFPDWNLISVNEVADIDATTIRRALFEAEDVDISLLALEALLPLPIRRYLHAWTRLSEFPRLVDEHRAVAQYKLQWRHTPFPPVFSTVDSVVKTAGHVLLIVRGAHPGKGLWALPGGFLEPRERLLQAAIRELCEETRLGVLAATLRSALADVKVFDHPDRSLRGRTITHAHYFDLTADHLPAIEGADDAAHAEWIPIERLHKMEDRFFDDHFHILDSFLHITEGA